MNFEVGKDYRTRGGWRARVIWIFFPPFPTASRLVVCHHPKESQSISLHDKDGALLTYVGHASLGGNHPADLVGEWNA